MPIQWPYFLLIAGRVSVGQLNRSAVLPSPDRGDHLKPCRNSVSDAIRCLQRLPEDAAIGARLVGSIGRRHFGS